MEGPSSGAGAPGLSVQVTPVQVGKIFPSRQDARTAAEMELAAEGRKSKNGSAAGSRQIHLVCVTCKGLGWFVKGCQQKTKSFKITKVGKEHVNCVGGGRVRLNVVRPMVNQLVRANPSIGGPGIKRTLRTAGFEISARTSQRAKQRIVKASKEKEAEAIARLPSLFEAIERDCTGSVATIEARSQREGQSSHTKESDELSKPTMLDQKKVVRDPIEVPAWTDLTDLASATFGGQVLFATDEWFASSERMLLEAEPIFNQEYTEFGKWMDGWESRRKRTAGHDWCIIRLGLPGRVKGVMVDTAFFTGNQAPRFSLQGTWFPEEPEVLRQLGEGRHAGRVGVAASEQEVELASRVGSEDWQEITGMTELRPGYETGRRHYFTVNSDMLCKVSHIRLNIFPDGGVARLRVHGCVEQSWEGILADEEVDLLAVENGGLEVGSSDRHYGVPKNMIKPGRGIHMGDGWETARKPGRPPVLEIAPDGLVKAPGSDWAILQLGTVGEIRRLVVDTNHFKGNFPESVSLEACCMPDAQPKDFLDQHGGVSIEWAPLLPRHKTGPSKEHVFELEKGELRALGPVSHVKLNIFPDGGVMRLRAFGRRCT